MSQASFVGRAVELEALQELARQAAEGRATTALLTGPAGMGKSTLLAALAAASPGFRLIGVSGDESERDLPYATINTILGRGSADWASPFSAGAVALSVLGGLCERGPVLFVVDDAHLCDAESLTAINFMMRRMRSDPLLLVLAVRPDGGPRLPPALSSHAERLALPALPVAAVRELSEALGRSRLSWHAASRVQAHTDGNPLHVRTLLEEVPVDALEDLARPIPAPASLAQLVVTELSRSTPTAQQVAAAAAVLGNRAPVDTLVAVAELTRDQVMDACEELSRARILRVAPGTAHCEFVHSVMRSAVYDDLGPASRAALHTRAAGRAVGREALQHRVDAAFGPDPALAADLEREAEDDALHGRLFRAARALLQSARLSPPGADADRRLLAGVESLLMAGDVGAARAQVSSLQSLPVTGRRLAVEARLAWLSGDATEAVHRGHEAWALADDLSAEQQSGLAALLAEIEMLRGDAENAACWGARALSGGRLDPAAAPHVRAVQSSAVGLHGQPHEAMRLLEELAADPTEVPRRRQPELAVRGNLRMVAGELAAAEADLAVSGSLEDGDLAPYRLTASVAHAESLFRRGRWDAARRTVAHVLGLADDMGQVWLTAYAHSIAAHVPSARGEWVEAERHVEAARHIAEQLGVRAGTDFAADAAVQLAAHRGDPEGVLAAAHPLRRLPTTAPARQPGLLGWHVHLVLALVSLGCPDEAQAEVEAHERLARVQHNGPGQVSATWLAGVIAAARRDSAAARSAFDRALAGCEEQVPSVEQILLRYHYGRFLRRRGERRRAGALLRDARTRAAGVRAEPLVQRCDEELAACGGPALEPVGTAAPTLTPQEQVIAALVCAGHTNREVAAKLVVSPKTVGYHLANVYAKLDVHSRLQLAKVLDQQP